MIKLRLHRKYFADTYTIGDLYIQKDDEMEYFFSNVLEDKVRLLPLTCPDTPKWKECTCTEKVKHETAIPYGTYKVVLSYSNTFKKVLPLLVDVPHFLGIRIHGVSKGAIAKAIHSSGCILIGDNTVKGGLTNSYEEMSKLLDILKKGNNIVIVIE